jgi:hypothetical protein
MQVERTDPISLLIGKVSGGRVSNAWAIYPEDWDNTGKPVLIPDKLILRHLEIREGGL